MTPDLMDEGTRAREAYERRRGELAITGDITTGRVVRERVPDFAKGVASLKALLYFGAMAAVFLYANLILLARRHVQDPARWAHLGARLACLLVIGIAVGVLSGRSGCRADLTAERLYSLNAVTKDVIDKVPADRPAVTTLRDVCARLPRGFISRSDGHMRGCAQVRVSQGSGGPPMAGIAAPDLSVRSCRQQSRYDWPRRRGLTDRSPSQPVSLPPFTPGPQRPTSEGSALPTRLAVSAPLSQSRHGSRI